MSTEILDPTGFPLDEHDPLASFHRLIHAYLRRLPEGAFAYGPVRVLNGERIEVWCEKAATEILQLPVADQFGCIRACTRFSYWSRFEWGWSSDKPETTIQMGSEFVLNSLCTIILDREREWSEDEIEEMVALDTPYFFPKAECMSPVVEKYLAHHPLTEALRPTIEQVREWNARLHRLPHWLTLGAALGESLVLHRGEKWADETITFISTQAEEVQEQWRQLLLLGSDSSKGKPSQKWLNAAQTHLEAIGGDIFANAFDEWSREIDQPGPVYEINQAVLKGLVWCAALVPREPVPTALGRVAHFAIKPAPMDGRMPTLNLFNASVWALGQLNHEAAKERLSGLQSQVKGGRLKSVEKALAAVAARS